MSEFKKAVYSIVDLIPEGKVASYGQVALYVGVPRAARQVGWTLSELEDTFSVPWWRVVNNSGRISIKANMHVDARIQKKLLESEGIIIEQNYTFSIADYRWLPSISEIKKIEKIEILYKKSIKKIEY